MDQARNSLPPEFWAALTVAAALGTCDHLAQGVTAHASRDVGHVDEAFRLASEALAIGVTYSSERVIQRARRFRRDYSGRSANGVRELDQRLRTTLL